MNIKNAKKRDKTFFKNVGYKLVYIYGEKLLSCTCITCILTFFDHTLNILPWFLCSGSWPFIVHTDSLSRCFSAAVSLLVKSALMTLVCRQLDALPTHITTPLKVAYSPNYHTLDKKLSYGVGGHYTIQGHSRSLILKAPTRLHITV